MNVPYLDVRAAHIELRHELESAFARVMDSGRYILGEELERFEGEFAAWCGTPHAVGVGNGLDALSIALRANGIGAGDEVIVPAHTFIATWLGVIACGARVVPVDVDRELLLIDPGLAAAACTERTAAIVPVHLYGHPVDPVPFDDLARRYGLRVVVDAAQAHGAEFAGRPAGALGNTAAFSFYPAKNLGAVGDGGALTTADEAVATRARRLRNYGSATKYEFAEIGVNSRLDPLQAALLREKLRALPVWNERRAHVAERYLEGLAGIPDLVLPARPAVGVVHAWHAFCVRHPRRDALRDHLKTRGVQTLVHYAVPPHLTPALAHLGFGRGSFPVTESTAETVLSLPMGPHLDDGSVAFVIDAIREFAA